MRAAGFTLNDLPDLTAAHAHARAHTPTRTIGEFALEYECRVLMSKFESDQTAIGTIATVQNHLDPMIFGLLKKTGRTHLETMAFNRLTELRLRKEKELGIEIDCKYLPNRHPAPQ